MKKDKTPGLYDYWKHLRKEETPFRLLTNLIGVLLLVYLGIQAFEAAYIYEDWRCFVTSCRILKAGDIEIIQLGDNL